MRPGRVVIINDSSVARGGATGLAVLLAEKLAGLGLRVAYVCGDAGENPALAKAGVDIIALGASRLLSHGAKAAVTGIENAGAFRMIRRVIAEHDGPDTVYHLHGWAQILSPAVFRALRPVAARTVIHAHDFFLACPNGAFTVYPTGTVCGAVPLGRQCITTRCDKRSGAQKAWRLVRHAALRRAFRPGDGWSAIAMIHPAMAPYLMRGGYPEAMLRTARNPVIPFTSERVRAEENSRVFYVGRLEPDKGVRLLARAAEAAGVEMTIIGEGPLREAMEAEHPGFRFEGWSSKAEIGALIRDARALVMPSISPEPFGLVAAEASLSGVPVVVSSSALLSREIAQKGIGLACDVRDAAAFAAALRRICDMNREDARTISEAAFSGRAGLALTPEAWVDRLLGLYGEALARVS